MSYVRTRFPRRMPIIGRRGVSALVSPFGGDINAWCDSWLGQTFSPQDCKILTPAGDAAVIADAAQHPDDYQAQIAAANHPQLSALFGPGFVATLFPVDVSDPNNPTPTVPWLMIGLGMLAGGFLLNAVRGRR